MSKNYAMIIVGAVVLTVGAYSLGRFMNESPNPEPEVPTQTAVRPPDPEPPKIKVPEKKDIELPRLPPKSAPEVVRNTDRVRQTLKPGKTYQTTLRGILKTRGTDTSWGIEKRVFIHYVFEAQIDREILENDGQTIVEHRHFRDVRSVKIDTELEDLRLRLDAVTGSGLILMVIGYFFPEAYAIKTVDGVSTAPALKFLKGFGVDAADLTGVKGKVFKMFGQVDGLKGKSVKLVYWNKEERAGVIRLVPLEGGGMTEEEQFLHHHSAVLSDALIFPEKKEIGQSWKVAGNNFSNLIDPGLRAAVRGELAFSRLANKKLDGKDVYVLLSEGGRLELESFDSTEGRLGWFEPRGEMLYSPDDQIIVKAEMSGKGVLERVSRTHLLFKTEMKQTPDMSISYSCTVIDTPGWQKK